MSSTLIAYWPIKEQPLSLGNLLTIRQELEILSSIRKKRRVTLYFSDEIALQAPYLQQALFSSLLFEFAVSQTPPHSQDWPFFNCEIEPGSYGSLRRINLLYQITQQFPVLSWPEMIQRQAQQKVYEWRKGFQRVIGVHLKQQSQIQEESNANMEEWRKLFSTREDCRFILLGKDPIPHCIADLFNVVYVEQEQMNLALQLAICLYLDGFLGMASGICSAAIFSKIPYVIFKHPQHHPEEMRLELKGNRFPFARLGQELWRIPDREEYLRQALGMIESHG